MRKLQKVSAIALIMLLIVLFIVCKVSPDATVPIVALTCAMALSAVVAAASYIYNVVRRKKA